MRNSDLYNVVVPELGDRADITVVSDAILQCEKNQSGKIEYMEASNKANTIYLISKTRNMNLKKYYYGMSMQFISPINMSKTTTYTIKVDSLDIQPFNFDIDIKIGDIVSVYYGDGGFSTSSYPIHNDSAKKSTKIIAGNGLTGGGDISGDRTINIVSEDDGIIVQPDYIKLNVYNDVNGTSGTRAASANAVKTAYDKALEASNNLINKLDKGTYPGTASDLKTEIDGKVNKAGDTMLAMLNFQGENIGISLLKKDRTYIGSIYGTETGTVYITNNISGKSIALYQDGKMSIQAENLTTPEKEIISAVNNLNNGKAGLFVWNKTTESPNINNLKEPGIYYLANDNLSPGSPDVNRAMMIVNNKDYPYQEWFPYFKPGVRYTRYWNGTTFSNWEKGSCITSTRDKLIIKDMTIQLTTGSPQTFYFDSAFPTACLGVMVGDTQNLVSNIENVQIYNTTRTNFTGTAVSIPEISPVAIAVKVIAIGY